MGEKTGIAWTDYTFNPWTGCAKVSPGCANCYAETMAARFPGSFGGWGVGQPRKRTSAGNWRQPLKWNKIAAQAGVRRKVFCASLGDWLDPEVPVEWLADLLVLIASTPHLDWQLLTKRPELWRRRVHEAVANIIHRPAYIKGSEPAVRMCNQWLDHIGAPPNVWVGTTVEDQRRACERGLALLTIPARVRFLSMEPLLEAVDLMAVERPDNAYFRWRHETGLVGPMTEPDDYVYECKRGVDWVIVGGESGPGARPFDLAWASSIIRQCHEAGIPVFVKQMGDNPVYTDKPCSPMCNCGMGKLRMHLKAHHGADPAEWPKDLRVQEFPC